MAIILKSTLKTASWWLSILLYISTALLLIAILTYFILTFYQEKTAVILGDLEAILAKERTAEEIRIEEKLFGWERKVDNFAFLVGLRQINLPFFNLVEGLTHPKVRWLELDLKTSELKVFLSGKTENFKTLEHQFSILRQEELIKEIAILEIIDVGGGVYFEIKLLLDPNLFKQEIIRPVGFPLIKDIRD